MSYTTPITDRSKSDITNKTSKAYFNVVDWQRIYDNSLHVRNLVQSALGLSIAFNTISTPTTSTIMTIDNLNAMLENIENVRSISETIETSEIKVNWQAGPYQDSPDYTHVNSWEENLHAVYTAYSITPVRYARTGIAKTGKNLNRNNSWR